MDTQEYKLQRNVLVMNGSVKSEYTSVADSQKSLIDPGLLKIIPNHSEKIWMDYK